jgi:hypothetical protein
MDTDSFDLPDSRVDFPGPFSRHDVVVSGWSVPFLHAQVHDGGMMTVVLDHRFGLELTLTEAERVVPFLADALAVALGYDAHPSADDPSLPNRSPHPKPARIVSIAGFRSDAG